MAQQVRLSSNFAAVRSINRGTEVKSRKSLVRCSKKGLQISCADQLRIGIVGGGTVGGGIVEIIGEHGAAFQELTGKEFVISKICVRDASKSRDYTVPEGCDVVTDVASVLTDDSIDMVVEVMGGTTKAKDVVFDALMAGKDVVTANKALIAAFLPELETTIDEVTSKSITPVKFGYEAAVCGGIPIIHSLQKDFVGDNISQISGIMNGTTNYMLTAMEKGASYDAILKEAQDLGYAEADPTADVGGFDARSKLKILTKLAFGIDVPEDDIACVGIQEVTTTDFEYAHKEGGTIKLLGVAKKVADDQVTAFVSPVFVPESNTLATVNGATNAVEVLSSSLQSSVYVGQGAGRYPTANSCISDIVAIAGGECSKPFPMKAPQDLTFVNDFESGFYIRLDYSDGIGIVKQVGEICEKHGVSIFSMLQNPILDREEAAFVLITDPVSKSAIEKVCEELGNAPWCKGKPFSMPAL